MGKRGGNHPVPGHFKVGGHMVEDRDDAERAKAALGREAAKRQRRAGRKTKLGAAPAAQRAKEPPPRHAKPSPTVQAAEREYARMNERKPPKRVKPGNGGGGERDEQPSYIGDTARRVIRTAVRYVYTPVALARAVVDRFRDRD